jgi:uncharacterized membrane protein YesL
VSRFFNQGNPFFRIMGVAFDLAQLNVLTVLCCLPVVSVGASLTAMHTVLWKMIRGEETYVRADFVASLKRDFRQATYGWLVFAAVAAVLGVDALAAGGFARPWRLAALAVVVAMGCAVLLFAQYFFMLVSRYENSLLAHLRNAALLSFGFLPRSVAMLAIVLGCAALCIMGGFAGIPLVLLFGIALPQYCCAWVYRPIAERLDRGVS